MIKNSIPYFVAFFLLACTTQTDTNSTQSASAQEENHSSQEELNAEKNRAKRKRICSTPPAPQNIWKLEPMLKQKGLIKDGMTKHQKEETIRNYINKKNSAYTQCIKGK